MFECQRKGLVLLGWSLRQRAGKDFTWPGSSFLGNGPIRSTAFTRLYQPCHRNGDHTRL